MYRSLSAHTFWQPPDDLLMWEISITLRALPYTFRHVQQVSGKKTWRRLAENLKHEHHWHPFLGKKTFPVLNKPVRRTCIAITELTTHILCNEHNQSKLQENMSRFIGLAKTTCTQSSLRITQPMLQQAHAELQSICLIWPSSKSNFSYMAPQTPKYPEI